MQSNVDYEASDGIAVLTLTDPPANTYSYEMMRALDDAVEGLDAYLNKRKAKFKAR